MNCQCTARVLAYRDFAAGMMEDMPTVVVQLHELHEVAAKHNNPPNAMWLPTSPNTDGRGEGTYNCKP
jgi:hypothetical protein